MNKRINKPCMKSPSITQKVITYNSEAERKGGNVETSVPERTPNAK